jgi:hypothetical protein
MDFRLRHFSHQPVYYPFYKSNSTETTLYKSQKPVRKIDVGQHWIISTRVIQKYPDLPPGARTASSTALCHWVQLYRYFVSQSNEFCRHNLLCCFWTGIDCCCWFRYRLSPETSGYTIVQYVTSQLEVDLLCMEHRIRRIGTTEFLSVPFHISNFANSDSAFTEFLLNWWW